MHREKSVRVLLRNIELFRFALLYLRLGCFVNHSKKFTTKTQLLNIINKGGGLDKCQRQSFSVQFEK